MPSPPLFLVGRCTQRRVRVGGKRFGGSLLSFGPHSRIKRRGRYTPQGNRCRVKWMRPEFVLVCFQHAIKPQIPAQPQRHLVLPKHSQRVIYRVM